MIVLKSAHEALLKAKDEQIEQLRNEVAFLRRMVQPSYSSGFKIQTEASAILDSRQDPIEVESELSDDEVASERDRILAGTY